MTYLTWIAFLLSLSGVVLNMRINSWCWYVWLVSNVLWIIYAWTAAQYPLLLQEIVFVGANIVGIFAWKNKTKTLTRPQN